MATTGGRQVQKPASIYKPDGSVNPVYWMPFGYYWLQIVHPIAAQELIDWAQDPVAGPQVRRGRHK